MRKIRVITMIAAAVALMSSPARGDNWERSFDVSGKPEVTIRTDDGKIQVVPGSSNQIEVSIETRGWEIGEGGVVVKAWQEGNRVEVEARVPRFRWSFGFKPRSLTIYVRVPKEVEAIELHSGDGSIEIESVSGRIDVRTGDGRVIAHELTGAIKLVSGDGSISVTDADGTLACTTGDGRIRVQGRFDALQLQSGDGSIHATAFEGSKLEDDWLVKTADGSLVLGVPEGLAANVDAQTGDGRINFEVPVTVEGRVHRSHLRGTLNGGGPELRLRSGDGSITIERSY